MAIRKSTPLAPELKAVLADFERWQYTACRLSKTTIRYNVGCVRRVLRELGHEPTVDQMQDYLIAMRQKNYRANYLINTAKALEHLARSRGVELKLCRPPAERNIIQHTLSEAEIAVLIHTAHTFRYKALLTLMAYSGLRNSELCNLLISDVDLCAGLIRTQLTKFNKARTVAITSDCIAVLSQYLQERKGKPNELLFITKRHGHQLQTQDIRKIVRITAKRAGFDRRVWPHLFRHSLATNMVDRGAHLLTVKDQLGHVFLESTMIYIHRSKKAHVNDYRQYAPSYT